jgi:hypothetical protein
MLHCGTLVPDPIAPKCNAELVLVLFANGELGLESREQSLFLRKHALVLRDIGIDPRGGGNELFGAVVFVDGIEALVGSKKDGEDQSGRREGADPEGLLGDSVPYCKPNIRLLSLMGLTRDHHRYAA